MATARSPRFASSVLGVGMAKFENVGRRDGPRTGSKARKNVGVIYD
jgi:hypothetical protein